jgi:hypothetical protein
MDGDKEKGARRGETKPYPGHVSCPSGKAMTAGRGSGRSGEESRSGARIAAVNAPPGRPGSCKRKTSTSKAAGRKRPPICRAAEGSSLEGPEMPATMRKPDGCPTRQPGALRYERRALGRSSEVQRQERGNREQGTRNREQGTGDRGQRSVPLRNPRSARPAPAPEHKKREGPRVRRGGTGSLPVAPPRRVSGQCRPPPAPPPPPAAARSRAPPAARPPPARRARRR